MIRERSISNENAHKIGGENTTDGRPLFSDKRRRSTQVPPGGLPRENENDGNESDVVRHPSGLVSALAERSGGAGEGGVADGGSGSATLIVHLKFH